MSMRTRSTTGSPVKKNATTPATPAEMAEQEPLKVLITPRSISPESRLILLKHPRDDAPKRFLFCPAGGLYELTKFAASPHDPRSLLFTYSQHDLSGGQQELKQDDGHSDKTSAKVSDGYINKDTDMLAATPFDLVFLLLRIMAPHGMSTRKAMYQPLDDVLDIPDTEDKHFRHVLERGGVFVERAMSRICDTVDAGDEKMFRYSESKVLRLLLDKADKVIRRGLPSSLEDRFVTRALEAPVLSVQREEMVSITTESPNTPGDSFDSQSTTASSSISAVFSEVSTTSTTVTMIQDSETVPTDFRRLQRLRTAFNFITTSYLPPALATRLQQALSTKQCHIDFQPLEEHLMSLAALRNAAVASRSISDYSRKREHADDDEAAEVRAEKKRKQEEEERKQKANMSRGVRDLKKVDVTGMKKMSSFFTKTPTAKAKT